MIGRAYTWKTSGPVAVTAEVGRLLHEGIVRGKKEYLKALVLVMMCRNFIYWGVLSVCDI